MVVKGKRTDWTEYGTRVWKMTGDLTVSSQAFIEMEHFGHTQKVAITWTSNRANRQRLFFLDDTGRKSEKLYYVDDRFVSRQVGKLTFRSQSYGKEQRLVALQELTCKRLKAPKPLPPEHRERLEVRFNEIEDARQRVEHDFWQNKWDVKKDKQAQRAALQANLMLAKRSLRQRSHVSSEYIIAKHADRLNELKKRVPRVERRSDPWAIFTADPPPLPKIDSEAVLDADLLRRMKLLRKGEVTAVELGWPIKWLPQRRRQIHVLFNLQDATNGCVLVIFQTPKRIVTQFFWIVWCGRRYGADVYAFECPETGRTSSILGYKGGRFELARRPPLPTLHSLLVRLRHLRLEKCLSGRSELTAEHIEILQKLATMPSFLSMYDDFIRDLIEMGRQAMAGLGFDANSSQIPIRPISAQEN
jgi:hypothetical protein